MKSIIVEADTVKKAVQIALAKLGTTQDKILVEILREEKKGLFDMGSSKAAKIRVRVKQT